jgi:hypothetical protein
MTVSRVVIPMLKRLAVIADRLLTAAIPPQDPMHPTSTNAES